MTVRYRHIYYGAIFFSAALVITALLLDPVAILPGLRVILTSQTVLITDYVAIAGLSATLINVALCTLTGVFVLLVTDDPLNGYSIVGLGLMAGFSFFGKNFLNIWPLMLGVFLYARYQKEPLHRYSVMALLSTAISPLLSFLALEDGWGSPVLAVVTGLVIGFILPTLSAYTFRIQNGVSLYNFGFSCGLLGMIVVPVVSSIGHAPTAAFYWATGYNTPFAIAMGVFCLLCILAGLFVTGKPPWAVWAGYRLLLRTSGRAPNDYLRKFESGTVLLNMGVNGLIGTAYILLIGGDLNGPTLGGIFTIIAFSAFGKHARNIIPIMLGVVVGSFFAQWSISDPAVQLAGLFCTTLAPISGYFGWPFGVFAGFLHSCVVLHAGTPVGGVNLYNNGFSGGLIAIVLYPLITAVIRHRKPELQQEDYFDTVDENTPLSPDDADGKPKEEPELHP